MPHKRELQSPRQLWWILEPAPKQGKGPFFYWTAGHMRLGGCGADGHRPLLCGSLLEVALGNASSPMACQLHVN